MKSWLLEFRYNNVILHDQNSVGVFVEKIGQEIQSGIGNCSLLFGDRCDLENGFTLLFRKPFEFTALVQGLSNGILTVDIHLLCNNGLDIREENIQKLREAILDMENICRKNTMEFDSLPAIKRGRSFSAYDKSSFGSLLEYDFDKLVFDQNTPYQNVRIFHSKQYGNCLVLDNDMNLSESDLQYTIAITGSEKEDYTNKEVLVLGGGDGGILHYLKDRGPKMITMIEIDGVVLEAAKVHLRGICGDSMDFYKGENYEIIEDDCVKYLQKYVEEGKKFDYVINDLTAIPISTKPVGSHWDFLRLILSLSMQVLKSDGKYFTQGNGANCVEALTMYEQQLLDLPCPVSFTKEAVCVPSYLEMWIFYTLWKTKVEK
ncbi:spermine synthase-like [Clavelina lepadiformis]|uniref:spermine synthase-like n=1 Tax=Clavelina lepadiformis TaxID=159417 RepID=UPI004042BF75